MWSAGSRTRPRIGRAEAWASLVARERHVRDGVGSVTLVEGPEGVGKTTFLRLVQEHAAQVGFRVAATVALPSEEPPPFQLMSAALRQVDVAKARTAPSAEPAHASVVFLPAFDGTRARYPTTDPLGAMMDDARSELASERLRFMDAMARSFLEGSEERPLLVVLDDLQFADVASLDFLVTLLPRLGDHRIWFLAGVSPPPTDGGEDALAAVRASAGVERIELRPFTEGEVGEFVRWLQPHRRLEESEARRLLAQSDGLPARLMELIAPKGGSAPPVPRAGGTSLLAEFGPEAQRVLTVAAVAGLEVTLELLANASGLSEERTIEHVERFIARGLLRELEDSRFSFDREETRVRVCAELGTRRLQLVHRKVAEALERSGSLDMATVFALARHTYLGGMDRDALRYNQQAAAFAAGTFQPGLALFYLRHALEMLQASTPEDHPTELQLRLAIAVQQVQLGEVDGAEESLREIQASERLWRSTTADDRALLSLYRARVLADQGRWDEANRSLGDLPAAYADSGPLPLRRAALGLRGEILFYRGDYSGALRAHEAALAIARTEGLPREVAAESLRRATALSMLPGRAVEAIDVFRSAIEELVRLGDYAEAAFGALCLGAHLNSQGQRDEARRELHRSIELAEAAHDLRRAGWARLNLADLEFGLGHLADAAEQIARARESMEQVEDALGQARAALTEGRLALSRADLELAEKDFEYARSVFSSRHLDADEMEVDLRNSELDLARHDEAAARERLRRLGEADLARVRPDLVDDWQRIRRQLDPTDAATS